MWFLTNLEVFRYLVHCPYLTLLLGVGKDVELADVMSSHSHCLPIQRNGIPPKLYCSASYYRVSARYFRLVILIISSILSSSSSWCSGISNSGNQRASRRGYLGRWRGFSAKEHPDKAISARRLTSKGSNIS
jgi:hypothetical protein